MSDYLMRDGAPFDEKAWAKIDEMVVAVMKKSLVGRRFVELVGPLGWGTEIAPTFRFTTEDGADVAETKAEYIPLVELEQEFLLKAKHMAVASKTPFGLDLGAVAIAATKLAKAEDELIITKGLLKAAKEGALGEWSKMGAPFKAIADAIAQMRGDGIDGPFAVVLSPTRYAQLASLMQHGMGRREMDMVEKLAAAGVFQYTGMPDDRVLVVSPQAWNFDLVVGQDTVTAYLGNEGLDHRFRIFETLVLRVKRPGAMRLLK